MRADLTLYVPPAIETGADVPVAILLHGVYGSHWAWTLQGGAHRTAARLIAAGEIPPMVLAMPSDGLWGDGSGYIPQPKQDFEKWIVDEVPTALGFAVPQITPRSSWFIAGLSMGGGQALSIGLNHLDIFHNVGAFSAGGGVRPDGMEAQYKDLLADPAATNKKLKFFYIACGKADGLFAGSQALHDTLAKHEIKHTFVPSEEGHVWRNWRNYLADFTPQLFR